MSKQLKPIIHGRDHCPDGADPIPCLTSPIGGSYEETVVATDDLLGYWRLGETGSPWADTSGTVPAADLSIDGSGTAPTADVTGALTDGDDGAVEFNYDGTVTTGGRRLQDPGSGVLGGIRFADLHEMTVSAWVKVKASAITRHGAIVHTFSELISPPSVIGWGLVVHYPARTIAFSRGQDIDSSFLEAVTGAGVVADQWYFVVGTFDGTTIRLYMNAVLADETADSRLEVGANERLRVGGAGDTLPIWNGAWFYGTVDEVAVWPRALTLTEIETLYASGVGEAAPAGSRVLVSDGEGGYSWGQVTTPAIEPGTEGYQLKTVSGQVVWALPTVRVNY